MSVAAGLESVRARIAAAERATGRPEGAVSLVAVSKRHSVNAMREAYDAGQRMFGENYAQELLQKHAELEDLPDLRLRMIGHVQRNKAKHLVRAGVTIDTIDSMRILDAVAKASAQVDRITDICIQVNVAGEARKSGCAVDQLAALIEAARERESLRLEGLMTIPPAGPPTEAAPHFRALRELAQAYGVSEISMGMSADLEVAVAEGATMVRIGTAIFGERPAS